MLNKGTVCIIQARLGSTRLPAKVMLDIEGKPVIHHVLDRVAKAKTIDRICVAVTTEPEDDILADAVRGYMPDVTVFRGSRDDVLDRYYQAAVVSQADVVVRITSDCPLMDSNVIDETVGLLLRNGELDYVANVLGRRTYPRGLDVEAFRFSCLERVWNEAVEADDREHVTMYQRKYPERFKTDRLENGEDLSFHRWTLDELPDYILISRIYHRLYSENPNFSTKDILAVFAEHLDWIEINQQIKQKSSH